MTADKTRDADRGGGLPEAALRFVTREVTRVPLTALSIGLRTWDRTRELRASALRQGAVVLQLAAHTPLGRFLPQPDIDDGAQDEAFRIAQLARASRTTPPAPPRQPAAPPKEAVEAGAPGAVADEVAEVTERLSIDQPESRDDLPIADFDNISIGSLRARLRSLSVEQLVTLREWEQAHGNRLPVITLLDNRIAKVASADSGSTTAATAPPYPSEGGSGRLRV